MIECQTPSAPALAADEDDIRDAEGHIPNLGLVKARIRAYYGDYLDSDGRHQCAFDSDWATDVAAVITRARGYLAARLAGGIGNPALVLDVDDTAVTTYPYLANTGFGNRQNREVLPAIPPVLELARYAHAQGVAIFLVTERAEARRADTLANLRSVGYPEPAGLFLRPRSAPLPAYLTSLTCTPTEFKSATRAHIQSRGFHVIASIGDQHSDLRGGHADMTFKLPNPMYHTP